MTNEFRPPTSSAASAAVQVAIVEDTTDIRESLRVLINDSTGFRCSGAYYSGEEALDKMARAIPDVVLMDLGLPKMSGIEAIQCLKVRYPQMLFLVLTIYDDDERIFQSLCAGACGYLLKKTPPSKLLEGTSSADQTSWA